MYNFARNQKFISFYTLLTKIIIRVDNNYMAWTVVKGTYNFKIQKLKKSIKSKMFLIHILNTFVF